METTKLKVYNPVKVSSFLPSGEGAFSGWSYMVEVVGGGNTQLIDTAALRAVNVTGLAPDTVYHVRVRAKSTAGSGPWSDMFKGRTLQKGEDFCSRLLTFLITCIVYLSTVWFLLCLYREKLDCVRIIFLFHYCQIIITNIYNLGIHVHIIFSMLLFLQQ